MLSVVTETISVVVVHDGSAAGASLTRRWLSSSNRTTARAMGEVRTMTTYPIRDTAIGQTFAFEIENVYISLSTIGRILTHSKGVSGVRKKPWIPLLTDVRVEFRYHGREYMVWEPYGDNSRYWIGPSDDDAPRSDISPLEDEFKRHRPSFPRRLVGDLVSCAWLTRIGLNDTE